MRNGVARYADEGRQQRWFAGIAVTREGEVPPEAADELSSFVRSIVAEAIGGYLTIVGAAIVVIIASSITAGSGWLGPVVSCVAVVTMQALPRRRLFSIATLVRLGRDVHDHGLFICEGESVTIEVLRHSHFIWRRNGEPLVPPMIANARVIAAQSEHAAMAAEFVRPTAGNTSILAHQRVLTEAELRELDSYAPRPDFTILVLAVVGIAGAVATYALALLGRIPTLLPPFVFTIAGVWASVKTFRAFRARRRISADLAAGYVFILRMQDDRGVGPPIEILPMSSVVWTENGVAAPWRRYWR